MELLAWQWTLDPREKPHGAAAGRPLQGAIVANSLWEEGGQLLGLDQRRLLHACKIYMIYIESR